MKIHTIGCETPLEVTPGYFAINRAHINYYIDTTTLRTRLSETQETAKSLMGMFLYDTVVGTTVCLEETQAIESSLAQELIGTGVLSMDAHKTTYIVTLEYSSNSRVVFKENILPMIQGKNVILLTASATTGFALSKRIESVLYYGEVLRGIMAIFSAPDEINRHRITSIPNKGDAPEHAFYDYKDCPFCKQDRKPEALVSSYGCIGL